jgi:UDP-GlcNAc3NAcA epimerase
MRLDQIEKQPDVLTIVGARPQFIKAVMVSRALKTRSISECIIHTGQHYDANMSDVFFKEMDIPKPAYNLEISGGTHGQMTGRQLESLDQVLLDVRPSMVLVYGDTNSTLAGALAASKLNIPVTHIEAGLRSFNKNMPEEINRIVTDHVSDLLLAPSATAMNNLENEGIVCPRAQFVGDVMFDAAIHFGETAEQRSSLMSQLEVRPSEFYLATVHRQENTNNLDRLVGIFRALCTLSKDIRVVLPLHPRTRVILERTGRFRELTSGIDIIEPVGFFEMITLMKNSRAVLTDSGGVQKEAYFHGKPIVVLRDETEWVELCDIGWAKLADASSVSSILEAARLMECVNKPSEEKPYGDGNAGDKIADILYEKIYG